LHERYEYPGLARFLVRHELQRREHAHAAHLAHQRMRNERVSRSFAPKYEPTCAAFSTSFSRSMIAGFASAAAAHTGWPE